MSLPRAEPICRCTGNGNSSMVRNTQSPTQVAQYLGRNRVNRIANAHVRSTLSQGPHGIWRMYSLLQRIKSLRHDLVRRLGAHTMVARCVEETPARELCTVDLEQTERIAALRGRYQAHAGRHRAILARRLPLLAPERPFPQIRHNLRSDGPYFMANHGFEEAALAQECCIAAVWSPLHTVRNRA